MNTHKAGQQLKLELTVALCHDDIGVTAEDFEESDLRISLLANSPYFFLDSVFIVEELDRYRLFVLHGDRVLADERAFSLDGAHSLFKNRFGHRSCKPGVQPDWSIFYHPDKEWLDDKLNVIRDPRQAGSVIYI
jgi:hypothetical protein